MIIIRIDTDSSEDAQAQIISSIVVGTDRRDRYIGIKVFSTIEENTSVTPRILDTAILCTL